MEQGLQAARPAGEGLLVQAQQEGYVACTFDPLHLQDPDLSSSKRVSFPLVQVLDRCSLWDIVAAVRALGLRVALSAKFLERNIIIVDNLQLTVSRHTQKSIVTTGVRLPPMYKGEAFNRPRGRWEAHLEKCFASYEADARSAAERVCY